MPRQTRNPDTPLSLSHHNLHAYARRSTRKLEVWIPDLDDAAETLGLSRAYVMDLLKGLEDRGAVRKLDGRRGIYIVEKDIPPVPKTAQ